MEKRKICCFCESWESGGIESFLNNMLCNMELDKFSIEIVASDLRDSVFTRALEEKGVRFTELSGSVGKVMKNRKLFKALLKERNFDAVHFNVFQALSFNYMSMAKKLGVPLCIAHSHNTALRKSLLRPVKLVIHRVSRALWANCADERWACSESAARFLFGRRSFTFIPNGIDTRRFAFDSAARDDVRAELELDGKFVAGCVGRLCSQKNQMFALDVFARLVKQREDAALLLVGDGEDEAALTARAKELKIEDKVIFYGVSSQAQRLYCAMDVLLFPSLFEGLGIVAIEAQSCGLAVICSENVPKEAAVTKLSHTVPLDKGAAAWAKAALENASGPAERGGYSELVKNAGFECAEVSKMIENTYLGI